MYNSVIFSMFTGLWTIPITSFRTYSSLCNETLHLISSQCPFSPNLYPLLPLATTNLLSVSIDLPIVIYHIYYTRCVVFLWWASLLTCFHPCCTVYQNVVTFYGWIMFHCIYVHHILFIHLCFDGYWVIIFWLLWIMVLWTLAYRCLSSYFQFLGGIYSEKWITGLSGNFMIKQTVFYSSHIILHSYQQYTGVSISLHPCQHWLFSFFLFFSFLFFFFFKGSSHPYGYEVTAQSPLGIGSLFSLCPSLTQVCPRGYLVYLL